jgi:hypothetical protein
MQMGRVIDIADKTYILAGLPHAVQNIRDDLGMPPGTNNHYAHGLDPSPINSSAVA